MSSIIDGYEYDIFISYRQNDNRSGWVTEFVKNLQEELAGTIKEPVSVYFDSNPHDGLLETHNVDKSLEGKLKCLIFIPILSQTYCDPNSFAWQNEFVPFNRFAANDTIRRDVRLRHGNVASRILPVQIHDLDQQDREIFENETGGPVRSIEFIYKGPGVNRPLRAHEDNPAGNSNRTSYRDQVNKVANAAKELLLSIRGKGEDSTISKHKPERKESITTKTKRIGFLAGIIGFFTIAVILYLLPSGEGITESKVNEKSLVILPFVNASGDPEREYFSDGLTEELLNTLSRLPELKVMARTTSFAFKNKNLPVTKIADSLNVKYVVEGSVRRTQQSLRITVNLINSEDGSLIWTNTYDHLPDELFNIQQSIAENIAKNLNVYLDDNKRAEMFSYGTRNVQAYENFMKGRAIFLQSHADYKISLWEANKYFEKAIQEDSTFGAAYWHIHDAYVHQFLDTGEPQPGTTHDEAYRQMHKYIDLAILHTPQVTTKNVYQIARIFFSNDWRNLKAKVENFVGDPQASKLMAYAETGYSTYVLIIMDRGNDLYRICREAIQLDPLQHTLYSRGILGALGSGQRQEAFDMAVSGEKVLGIEIAWGSVPAYLSVNKTMTTQESFFKPLLLSKAGRKPEALKLAAELYKQDSLDFRLTWIYHELGDFDKANYVASNIDKLPMGHLRLVAAYMMTYSLENPVFDISKTPNFAARLKEAEISFKGK